MNGYESPFQQNIFHYIVFRWLK